MAVAVERTSNDRTLAEALFAQRAGSAPRQASAGRTAAGVYVASSGFAGVACEAHWVGGRPPALDAFPARLAAKVARHNFCLWRNRSLGHPGLAFAELLGW